MSSLKEFFAQYGNIVAVIVFVPTILWVIGTQVKSKKKRNELCLACALVASSGVVVPHEITKIENPIPLDGTVAIFD